jgi:hypothetical protein
MAHLRVTQERRAMLSARVMAKRRPKNGPKMAKNLQPPLKEGLKVGSPCAKVVAAANPISREPEPTLQNCDAHHRKHTFAQQSAGARKMNGKHEIWRHRPLQNVSTRPAKGARRNTLAPPLQTGGNYNGWAMAGQL